MSNIQQFEDSEEDFFEEDKILPFWVAVAIPHMPSFPAFDQLQILLAAAYDS